MKLHSLSVSGIAPHYRTPQTLDLAAIPGPLVAITGQNGSGKSTLVGALRAAIFRRFASGARLAELATAADSYVRADIETARGRFVITQAVNGVSKSAKGETSIRDAAGRDLLSRAQVSEGDAWIARNLPPWSLIAASTFAAQADQGLLAADLTPQDRREILFRALGLDAYEPCPQRCRDLAGEARRRGEVIDGQIAVERPRADVEGASKVAGSAQATAAAAMGARDAAATALADARARHAALLEAFRNAESAKAARAAAAAVLADAQAKNRALGLRQNAADATLADRDAVRVAVARVGDLDMKEIPAAESALSEARARAETARADVAAASRAESEAARRVTEAESAVQRAEAAAKDLPNARAAGEMTPKLLATVEDIERRIVQAEGVVELFSKAALDVAGRRIDGLRKGHEEIAGKTVKWDECITDFPAISRAALDADDGAVATAAEAPAALDAARKSIADLRAKAREGRDLMREGERLAARLPDLERAAADLVTATAARDLALADRAEATKRVTATRQERDLVETAERRHLAALTKLRDERRVAALTAARAPEIAAAEATARELLAQRQESYYVVRDAQAALDALPEPPASEPVPDVAAQERAVQDAEAALRRAEGAVAVAERALSDAQAAAGRVADLESQRRRIDEEIADALAVERTFTTLLQLSIDAAGPELAAITTDLLRGGFGDRYAVTVETQRPTADGKGTVEDCFVQVTDSVNGYSGPASGLSGGQLVIVGTAVRCALARIGARTAGIERPTLILDEAGAALEEPLIPAWVGMLRHAARVTGAEHVLVVGHNPDVWALCDSVVRVNDGRIEVAA